MPPVPPGAPESSWFAALSPERWLREFRAAARSLRRAPGFALAVLVTLILCIGPNTAVLSTLYALVLKPLPFPQPQELVTFQNIADKRNGQAIQSSYVQYRDFKAHADLYAGFAIVLPQNITLEEGDAVIRIQNDWITSDFFDVLGVKPVIGRFFAPDEEAEGRNNVLVLSHAYWLSRYQADPKVIGQTVHGGGATFTIVGVAPATVAALSPPTCFFQPYAPSANRKDPQSRYAADATLYGRLRPGVTAEAGLAQLSALEKNFRDTEAIPRVRSMLERDGYRLTTHPLRPGGLIGTMPGVWLLQGGALFVLLIGAVNVVNLFLARMNAKRPELVTRVALGASWTTLMRQSLAESMLLSGAAAVGGIGVAVFAVRIFNRYLPIIERTAPPVTLDFTVIGIVLAGTAVIALFIGALPLQLLWRTGLRLGDMRTTSSNRRARAVSSALVTTQVGIAVVLLIGAALLLRSFSQVLAVQPGFEAVHIMQGRIALGSRYGAPAANIDVQRRILAAMHSIPGVQNVAEIYGRYGLVPETRAQPILIRGSTNAAGDTKPMVNIYTASSEIFATLGMRVLDGRGFDEGADYRKDFAVVVDQTFAQRYFPGQSVIGQELVFSPTAPTDDKWFRIIGVVTRANLGGLEQRDIPPFLYVPFHDTPVPGFNVLVRSPRPSTEILREMRAKLRAVDPSLPLYLTGSLQEGIDSLLMPRRGTTLLLTVFAGLALLLAAVGLYGVLAYDVSQRTREIGIRGAIGASRQQIVALILRQGMTKAGIGLALGVGGALYLTRFVRSQLFEVGSIDPLAYAVVLLSLSAVALLACWLPARRAAMVNPVIALRAE